MFGWGKLAAFVGGALFGSAGIKILTSKDAKKVYVHTTAAALRMKDCVMETATTLQETARTFWQRPRRSTKPGQQRKNSTSKTRKKPSANKLELSGRLRKRGRPASLLCEVIQ